MRLPIILLVSLFVGLSCAGISAAGLPATNDIKKVDADFALTGEFLGNYEVRPSEFRPIALQIRSLGDGQFEAIQLDTLPNGRKTAKPPIKLIGKQHEGFLVLSGGPWGIFVEKDGCILMDRKGKRIGQLSRVIRQSPTLGAKPPKDAIVLFDGTNVDNFVNGQIEDGLLMEGADLKPMFQDFHLHVEFRLPYMPTARDQARSNSGVYLQSRYEVQVLDSFATEPRHNGCGGLYRFRVPDANMCFPPLTWQTYDITFTAPRWNSDGKKRSNARLTVLHNGIKIHDNVELPNKTGAGKPEEPTLLPIRLQNHSNPVRFRNIWIIDRGISPAAKFPVMATAEEPKKPEPKKPAEKKEPEKKEPEKKPEPKKPAEKKAEPKKPAPEKKPAEKRAEPKKPEPKKAEAPAKLPFDCIGVWKVADSEKKTFHITIHKDGKATTDWHGGETGTWKVEGNRIHCAYTDGWHDFLVKEGNKFKKIAFGPGMPLDGKPENTSPAERIKK